MTNEEISNKVLGPSDQSNTLEIKAVYDPSRNKIYYQTEPFLKDGKVIIKRIAEVDVEIEQAFQVVEEYSTTTKDEESANG